MKKNTLKPLCLAVGLALAGSASAVTMDFSGSNFYMKFLDGNQHGAPTGSIDNASGADSGQFTELNLIFKARISPKVEAGGRIQSRSSAADWTEFGGFGSEGTVANDSVNHQKMMKLRGAYIELSPGYSWLSQVRIGTSDWGMFDPFTVGKIRYIDRDNLNGFYFKGPLDSGGTWELGRVSLPEYLGVNFNVGSVPKNQAIYIAQLKKTTGDIKWSGGYTYLNNNEKDTADTNLLNGQNLRDRMQNTILSLKADTAISDAVDFRGSFHHSTYSVNNTNMVAGMLGDFCYNNGGCGSTSNAYLTTGVMGYSMTPGANVNGNAVKIDFDWRPANIESFTLNYQYFNIGAGYLSVGGSRRETDVLLTDGSEGAWYGWGKGNQWLGGRSGDMQQAAVIHVDNNYTDFEEAGSESVIGWKGHTFKANYETSNTPMTLEYTAVGYNTNWQNYGGNASIYDVAHGQGTYDVYNQNQDRKTNIIAFKLNHNLPVMGGVDANLKFKYVDDKDGVDAAISTDDRAVKDTGISASLGKQLTADLHGMLTYGHYTRKLTVGAAADDNSKNIYGVKFAYNLPGFELGLLAQTIRGTGNPTGTVGATKVDINQYRMKAFAQVNF
jgi:hypothetical protein